MVNEELIPKIEESLGFKLYPKVIEYLTTGKYNFSSGVRKEGATTAHILKQILDNNCEEYIDLDMLKNTNRYVDIIPNRFYKRLYYSMFMKYYHKLKNSGFEVIKLVTRKKESVNPKIKILVDTSEIDKAIAKVDLLNKKLKTTIKKFNEIERYLEIKEKGK